MNKLSLEALKNRAEAIASVDLLATISGGNENACHDRAVIDERSLQGHPCTGDA